MQHISIYLDSEELDSIAGMGAVRMLKWGLCYFLFHWVMRIKWHIGFEGKCLFLIFILKVSYIFIYFYQYLDENKEKLLREKLCILKQFLIEFSIYCFKITTQKWVIEWVMTLIFQSSKFQWQNMNIFLLVENPNISISLSLYKSNCKALIKHCLC